MKILSYKRINKNFSSYIRDNPSSIMIPDVSKNLFQASLHAYTLNHKKYSYNNKSGYCRIDRSMKSYFNECDILVPVTTFDDFINETGYDKNISLYGFEFGSKQIKTLNILFEKRHEERELEKLKKKSE